MRDRSAHPVRRARALVRGALLLPLLAACGADAEPEARGPGLAVAELPPASQAAAYEAAIRAGFDVAPGLTLLVAPEHLPRTATLAGGPPVDPAVIATLRERGVVQGTCAAAPVAEGEVPRCEAAAAGYLLRLSQPFTGGGDTLQVYVDAERYARPGGPTQGPFFYETAYQLVGRGTDWRVVRDGRVPTAARTRGR